MMTLFHRETHEEYFKKKKADIKNIVKTLSLEDFEQQDITAMAEDLSKKTAIEELSVTLSVSPQNVATEMPNMERYHLPVQGNIDLLFVKPSLQEEMTFAACLDKAKNLLVIVLDKHSAYDAQQLQALQANVEQINRDVMVFNMELPAYVEEELKKQRLFLRTMEKGVF